jgi:hypothetical protein
LGYQWLLIHNGTARCHNELVPPAERLIPDADSDTPRVFEFLRQQIIDYCGARPQHSLIEACRRAFGKLVESDPKGKFNLNQPQELPGRPGQRFHGKPADPKGKREGPGYQSVVAFAEVAPEIVAGRLRCEESSRSFT